MFPTRSFASLQIGLPRLVSRWMNTLPTSSLAGHCVPTLMLSPALRSWIVRMRRRGPRFWLYGMLPDANATTFSPKRKNPFHSGLLRLESFL